MFPLVLLGFLVLSAVRNKAKYFMEQSFLTNAKGSKFTSWVYQ